MNRNTLVRTASRSAAVTLLLAMSTAAVATTTSDVAREVDEAMTTIAGYTAEQRNEAVSEASQALAALDKRLEAAQERFDNGWDSMDSLARQKARFEMARLRKQRSELSEWYGGIKHSSVQAWEQVKDGFATSYRALSDSLTKAYEAF